MKREWITRKVLLVSAALGSLLLSSAALAATVDEKKLVKTAHELDIIGMTDELVELTGTMLTDTNRLSGKIEEVGTHLAMLDMQKEELEKQVQTNRTIAGELDKQLVLNKEARGWMQQILSVQGQTGQLTNQVAAQASSATGQVIATTNQLAGVGEATGQLNSSTQELSERLDTLNKELDNAADSFRFVGRLTKVVNMLPLHVGDTARGVTDTAGKTVQDITKNPTDVNKHLNNAGKTVGDTVNGVGDTLNKSVRSPGSTTKPKQPATSQERKKGQGNKGQGNKGQGNKGMLPRLHVPLLGGSDE